MIVYSELNRICVITVESLYHFKVYITTNIDLFIHQTNVPNPLVEANLSKLLCTKQFTV